MILVTLGTQDKSFVRLLEAVEKQVKAGILQDRIVVQAGCTQFQSDAMEIFDLIDMAAFDKLMEEADLIITHGGVGSIITGLKRSKKIIAAARLEKYHEHVNDHQLQIIRSFAQQGYLLALEDFDQLGQCIQASATFQPRLFISNSSAFISMLEEELKL